MIQSASASNMIVNTNTVWTSDVVCDSATERIQVAPGITLGIDPGVTVNCSAAVLVNEMFSGSTLRVGPDNNGIVPTTSTLPDGSTPQRTVLRLKQIISGTGSSQLYAWHADMLIAASGTLSISGTSSFISNCW
jgi:hypothetical protein